MGSPRHSLSKAPVSLPQCATEEGGIADPEQRADLPPGSPCRLGVHSCPVMDQWPLVSPSTFAADVRAHDLGRTGMLGGEGVTFQTALDQALGWMRGEGKMRGGLGSQNLLRVEGAGLSSRWGMSAGRGKADTPGLGTQGPFSGDTVR